MTARGARVFVDSNVLVYAHDASEKEKQPIAREVLEELWRSGRGALSTQVLQEFYVVATRKFDPPMSRREARAIVGAYGEWRIAGVDIAMITNASLLEERHRLSFWDALILEAARRCGAARLLSEDMSAESTLGGVLIENPFAGAPRRSR